MNTPAPAQATSLGQAFLALIESDLATIGGQPLIALLTALQSAKGNTLLQQGAIMQFVAAGPTIGLSLGIEIEQQLIQLAINKVQAFIASKSLPPPA